MSASIVGERLRPANAPAAPDTLGEPVLVAAGLSKRYGGARVVDRVSVEIEAGQCWGLLGPNGAGKTTLLRMLLGATAPDEGRLRVLGHAVPHEAARMRARIGVVPQIDNLDPEFTVAENLRAYAAYFGLRGREFERRLTQLLVFASLEGRADARIGALSGGMQRRLTLSRALVNDPELLILDEPTTGLDPQARQIIWQRLRELKRKGLTLILTTHYMEEAERLCDRVSVMDHGRLLETERPRALVDRHIEPEVVEVHGAGLDAWHEAVGARLAERSERVGDTALYYARDARELLAALAVHAELAFLHRRANLEDVFLKLTGRELRDA